MALTIRLNSAYRPEDLATELNTLLATVLSQRLSFFEFDQTGMELGPRKQSFYSLTLDTDGASVITTPYEVRLISGENTAVTVQLLQAFIDANPTYWFSPAFALFTPPFPGEFGVRYLIFFNQDATDGAANWGPVASGGGGPPSGPAGGDLAGTYPDPEVVGLHTIPFDAPTVDGTIPSFDLAGNQIVWTNGQIQTTGLTLGPNVVDSVPIADFGSVVWAIACQRTDVANQRYSETVIVTHDGTDPYLESQGVAVVPAASAFVSTSAAIAGGDLQLTVTFTTGTWKVDVKRLSLVDL